MALSEVHELSSILRTEDLEKSELNRKKFAIELAIKQQEGRLVYEVEERDRCIRGIASADVNLQDLASSHELKELVLQQLQKETDIISHLPSKFQFSCYEDRKVNLLGYIGNISERVCGMERAMVAIEKNQLECTSAAKQVLTQKLHKIGSNLEASLHCTDDLKTAKEMKLMCLEELDVRASDVSSETDKLKTDLGTLDETLTNQHETVQKLEVSVAERQAESAKEDFHYSAELGKRSEAIAALRDKINDEAKIITAVEEECTALTRVVNAILQKAQEVSDRMAQAQKDLEDTRAENGALTAETVTATQAQTSLASELTAVKQLQLTITQQSFKPRADELAKELGDTQQTNASAQSALAQLEAQIQDELTHVVLRGLKERIALAGEVAAAARDRLRALCSESDALLQAQPLLDAELQRTQSDLQLVKDAREAVARDAEALRESSNDVEDSQHLHEPADATRSRIAALEQALAQSTTEQQQIAEQTQAVRDSAASRAADLQEARRVLTDRDQAVLARMHAKDKQKRVAAAKVALASRHKQSVMKLQKALQEEDKQFQLAHQQDRTAHDAAMSALAADRACLAGRLAVQQERLARLRALRGECEGGREEHQVELGYTVTTDPDPATATETEAKTVVVPL